jgi:hypothetical protein
MRNVGGLIGVLDASVSTTILESYNQGQVESNNGSVGGLVGKVAEALAVSNSYNVGQLSGTTLIGGIVGDGSANTSVNNSYFAGSLESTGTSDGLVAGNFDEVSNSYAITTSVHVSASTQLELQTRATFAGWDFDDVWVFGSCEINDSFPVLLWAEPIYFDLSCIQTQTQTPSTSSSAPTSSPAESPSAPATYNGPVVDSGTAFGFPGDIIRLSGTKLGGVFEVIVNGISLEILSTADNELVFKLPPEIGPGDFDIVMVSPYGRLTVMNGISIKEIQTSAANYGELLGFRWVATFIGNSRFLSESQTGGISSFLDDFASATTIVCWGYTTSSSPNAWAIAHATERATAVCDLVSELRPDAKVYVRVRHGMPKFAAMRATAQFWELKRNQ